MLICNHSPVIVVFFLKLPVSSAVNIWSFLMVDPRDNNTAERGVGVGDWGLRGYSSVCLIMSEFAKSFPFTLTPFVKGHDWGKNNKPSLCNWVDVEKKNERKKTSKKKKKNHSCSSKRKWKTTSCSLKKCMKCLVHSITNQFFTDKKVCGAWGRLSNIPQQMTRLVKVQEPPVVDNCYMTAVAEVRDESTSGQT